MAQSRHRFKHLSTRFFPIAESRLRPSCASVFEWRFHNNKGFVTFDRKPKESFHFLREHVTGVKAPKRATGPPPAPQPADPAGKVVNPFEVKE